MRPKTALRSLGITAFLQIVLLSFVFIAGLPWWTKLIVGFVAVACVAMFLDAWRRLQHLL